MGLPEHVTCAIAGGGPAGMMLGVLLARAGVDVCVFEKHADFLRDFRGDTVHPSTMEVMHELGILDAFLARPHQKVRELHAVIDDREYAVADFSHLPVRCPFIAFMPQWDFLDFLAGFGRRFGSFQLVMEAEAVGVERRHDQVTGLRVKTAAGESVVSADLVIGADGRGSVVRRQSGLPLTDLGAPMDVLWLQLPKADDDEPQSLGRAVAGRLFVMLDRDTYWQCAFVITKGGFDEMRAAGLDAFRDEIARAAPQLRDRTSAIASWDDVKLLTVEVNRLDRWWQPGLLCIGDAAHAMSPIGGVGINLAIQDAVAAANHLACPLRDGTLSTRDLARVEQRRRFPTRATQGVQVFIQRQIIRRLLALQKGRHVTAPWPIRALDAWPLLRRLPARAVGLGARPEHVEAPAIDSA